MLTYQLTQESTATQMVSVYKSKCKMLNMLILKRLAHRLDRSMQQIFGEKCQRPAHRQLSGIGNIHIVLGSTSQAQMGRDTATNRSLSSQIQHSNMRVMILIYYNATQAKYDAKSSVVISDFIQYIGEMNQKQQRLLATYSEASVQVEGNIFFELIHRVGAFGKYQIYSQLAWCLMSYLAGGLLFITAFLFYQDPYQCKDPFPGGSCLDYVCSLDLSQRAQFIPDRTFLSLANKFADKDYRCPTEKQEIALVQTLLYSGFPIGIFVLSLLGGVFRKKTLMLVNLTLSIVGIVLVRISPSLLVGGIGMFWCIFGLNINVNISYPFITETVSQRYRPMFSMLIAIFYAVGSLGNVLWFYLLRNFEDVFVYCYGIPTVLLTIIVIFFIQDAPICMITKSSPEKALKGLKHISKINQKAYFDLTTSQLRQIQKNYKEITLNNSSKTFSIIDIFRYKSLRTIAIVTIFLDSAIALQYYTPTLIMDQFDFSIFVNGLVIESSQVMASIASTCMVLNFPRKKVAIISFFAIFASSFGLIFLWDQDKSNVSDIGANIIILVLVFVIGFAITNEFNFFVVYLNELMPTQIRIVAMAFIKTFGGIVLMVESQIISACQNAGFKIMILFAILAGLCIGASFLLPETQGKAPPDMIEQLRADTEQRIPEDVSGEITDSK